MDLRRIIFMMFLLLLVMSTASECTQDEREAGCNPSDRRHTVVFYDFDGTVLNTQEVWHGEAAIPPAHPVREGYTFSGWSDPFVNITTETIIIAQYEINEYLVTFFDHDGTEIKTESVEHGSSANAPMVDSREGHTFTGWDVDFNVVTGDLIVNAQYLINHYIIYYYDQHGELIETMSYPFGVDLSGHVEPDPPEHEYVVFLGWVFEDVVDEPIPETMPAQDLHRFPHFVTMAIDPHMVQVGEQGTAYTIPTGTDDAGTATVFGGYVIFTTPMTYDIWYAVRVWAGDYGYYFVNPGREGCQGVDGAAPTTGGRMQPVTNVSWRDVIVWLNAYSEYHGYDPVYRSYGVIVRDADDFFAMDTAVQGDYNGYRLPTSNEWEMAGRWRNDTESTDGSILVGGRWWTPGNHASGATADINDETETGRVAWYDDNSGGVTQRVAMVDSGVLGLYDMSGNVWEWTDTSYMTGRVVRGSSVAFGAYYMQVGGWGMQFPFSVHPTLGFRPVRTPGPDEEIKLLPDTRDMSFQGNVNNGKIAWPGTIGHGSVLSMVTCPAWLAKPMRTDAASRGTTVI